jgi:hypothetical protein
MTIKQQFVACALGSFVVISQLAAQSNLNDFQLIAVALFFVALSVSATAYFCFDEIHGANAKGYWLLRGLSIVAGTLVFGALILLACSFALWIGIVFLFSTLVILLLFLWHYLGQLK